MADVLRGGCLCRALRYRASGAPVTVAYCHCTSCRRASAAPVVAWAMWPLDRFELTAGAPSVYGSSPGVERAFVADPDFILVGAWPRAVEGLKEQPLLSNLRAVRENRIIVMPNELLVALSQYTADACRYLASRLHPDRVPGPRP